MVALGFVVLVVGCVGDAISDGVMKVVLHSSVGWLLVSIVFCFLWLGSAELFLFLGGRPRFLVILEGPEESKCAGRLEVLQGVHCQPTK